MKFTDKEIQYIKDNIGKQTFKEMACNLDRSVSAVKSKAYILNLHRNTKHFFTPQEDQFIIEKYPNISNESIATYLGVSILSVNGRAHKLGVKKSREYMQQFGYLVSQHPNTKFFEKGKISLNKGKKQIEFMSPEAIENSKKTRFKKGNNPHNIKFDGAEYVDIYGYTWVRISEKNWMQKHRLLWEEHFGEIPTGTNIQFCDGIRSHITIDNLYSITREEQMRKNTIQNYPPEVQTTFRLMGKINKLIQNQENEKTN